MQQVLELAPEDANYLLAYGAQLVWLRREQGDNDEVLSLLELATAENPGLIGERSALALGRAEVGDEIGARADLEALATDAFASIPNDFLRTSSLCWLTELCGLLGDERRAHDLYPLLRPHSGHLIAVSWGIVCIGAADRYLGILAATLGRLDEAERLFEAALSLEREVSSEPLLARTRYWFARMLAHRASEGDVLRALSLLESVLESAEGMGMARLAADAGLLSLKPGRDSSY
jgi:tetratricopeptide (TPR) repeat protein